MPTNDRVYLATTRSPEIWNRDLPLVLLGEWCKPDYALPLNTKTHQTLPFHWQSLEEKHRAYELVARTTKRLIPRLGEWLNETHQIHYDPRTWATLLSPFIVSYVGAFYDRYRALERAISEFPRLTSSGLNMESVQPPASTNHLVGLLTFDDLWNLGLYGRILSALGYPPSQTWNYESSAPQKKFPTYRQWLRRVLLKIQAPFARSSEVLLFQYTLPWSELLKIYFVSRGKIFPFAHRAWPSLLGCGSVDHKTRVSLRTLGGSDSIERLIFSLLESDLPRVFLEDFECAVKYSRDFASGRAKLILSDQGWYHDEVFRFFAARKRQEGALLGGIQHGGNYTNWSFNASDLVERDNLDLFITWGKSLENHKDVLPLSANRLTPDVRAYGSVRPNGSSPLLWITSSGPRHTWQIADVPFSSEFLDYFNMQIEFLTCLSPKVREMILLRDYPYDFGWKSTERLTSAYPELKVAPRRRRSSVYAQMLKSRLVIIDNNNTVLYQALTYGIPTILFWDEKFWGLSKHAKPFFEELKACGILHTDARSAADQVARVFEDPSRWWNTPLVQSTVSRFCEQFCKRPDHWPQHWSRELNLWLDKRTDRAV